MTKVVEVRTGKAAAAAFRENSRNSNIMFLKKMTGLYEVINLSTLIMYSAEL